MIREDIYRSRQSPTNWTKGKHVYERQPDGAVHGRNESNTLHTVVGSRCLDDFLSCLDEADRTAFARDGRIEIQRVDAV
jgi:hypothetical protein